VRVGDNAAKKAGGAAGLGFLPKGMVGANERGALQTALGDASGEVKEAAASALGKVGEEGSAADLTRAAGDANQDVQVAALRALANIKPKNPDTIKALSDMVADEPEKIGDPSKKVLTGAKADQVREWATAALGEIGDPSAGKALLRARRDTAQNVREAATVAIQKVYKADGKGLVAIVLPVFQSEKNKTGRPERRRAAPGRHRRGRPGPRAGRPAHRHESRPASSATPTRASGSRSAGRSAT
jgi:hypothetical protein